MVYKTLIFAWLATSLSQGEDGRTSFEGIGSNQNPFDCGLIIRPRATRNQQRESICITYAKVNEFIGQSLDTVGFNRRHQSNEEISSHQLGLLGLAVNEVSRLLAFEYNLSRDAVAIGLSRIDTSRTLLRNYCPNYLMTPQCKEERYRRTNGLCNNLNMPHWGAARHAHIRYLNPPEFDDGISAPRIFSVTGRPLPSARAISMTVHGGKDRQDHAATMMLVLWGQFLDHDVTATAEEHDEETGLAPECCKETNSLHPNCMPIEIPANDPFYKTWNRRCMNFVRTLPGLLHQCRIGPRTTFNEITSFIDASNVYSSKEDKEHSLRSHEGGQLRMLNLPSHGGRRMKPLLPARTENPDNGCIRPSNNVFCFEAGDARVNEQTALATLHTLFAREHNRVARQLALVNPHWSDETLYKESKHIVSALMQKITYNEFLPMLLGQNMMQKYGLLLQDSGYYAGYDDRVDASIGNAFASAAFRVGHSLLPSQFELYSPSGLYQDKKKLSTMLLQPYDLYQEGRMDQFVMGLTKQLALALDNEVTSEVQNHLFQKPLEKFGLDLAAINIQRGREHGLQSWNRWREWCNLPVVRSFDELRSIMPNSTVNKYIEVYDSVDDLDLWSAGTAELPAPGAMVGSTFACILGKQFRALRDGDRFWHENGGYLSSFTLEQLDEIRKVKLSRIICDNTDELRRVQVYAMVLEDNDINPAFRCAGPDLERMDFNKWRDSNQPTRPINFPPQRRPPQSQSFNQRPFSGVFRPFGSAEDNRQSGLSSGIRFNNG